MENIKNQWNNYFEKIINKAIMACENSNFNVMDHFIDVSKMIEIAKGAKRKVLDYKFI